MKLTDFLQDVGRPVAYFPKLKRITGSTTATILLCQFIYWRGKEADQDGWLYKTSEEIEDETGLTYNEQKTARKVLVEAELLQEHYARLDHQLRFKIDLDKINESWGIEPPKNGESDDSTLGNDESPFSLNSNTETTAENNTPSETNKKRGDLLDGILDLTFKPKAVRDAFAKFFRLTPNWEAKYNRQFLEWAVEIGMVPEQVQRAADVWRSDKRFNWTVPTLRGIQEHWFELIETSTPEDGRHAL